MAMPLQNRVAPDGEIVALAARGLFTGNRGIIHDPQTRTLLNKRWSGRAWLVCILEFQNRRREVMTRQSWTELFFLDEATALAAGHRPCFHCRRTDAERFRAAWTEGNGATLRADEIDGVLDTERRIGRAKRRHQLPTSPAQMPDGVMLANAETCYLINEGRALRWSFKGYVSAALPAGELAMLTPPSTFRALQAGYTPVLHGSALDHVTG